MREAIRSLSRRQGGFTLVEMLVTMLVMGVVATSVMAVALRAFTDTGIITNRRDVFGDGRIALDRLSKQLRQGEAIDATSSPTMVKFTGYIDGAPKTIVWRVIGSAAPYSLQESRNGGASYATLLSALSASNVFTYTQHGTVTDQVTIRLSLGTKTSTAVISSDVFLRNAAS